MGITNKIATPALDKLFNALVKGRVKDTATKETKKVVTPTLTDIFNKGVDKYSKEELEAAIASARHNVYRYDRYAPELMEKGFQSNMSPPLIGDDLEKWIMRRTELTPEELHKMVRTGKFSDEAQAAINEWKQFNKAVDIHDKPGLYWGRSYTFEGEKHNFDTGLVPPYQSKSEKDLIVGVTNPNVQVGDLIADQPGQLRQTKPGQVLAKYGDIFKIIGLGGATTLGSQLIPGDEAEAAIPGKIGEMVSKEIEGAIGKSSAAKKAIGKIWPDGSGKVIKDIFTGKQDWRYILFEDGTHIPVTKDVLADTMKEIGTQTYMEKLAARETESSKLQQAYRSLQHHLKRQQPLVDKEAKEEWRNNYSKYMNDFKFNEVPWTYVESHNVYLPEEYAKILEDANVIQIKKVK